MAESLAVRYLYILGQTAVRYFYILGQTFDALSAQLRFWIDPIAHIPQIFKQI